MKKTLALLICLAMLFTALSVNVFAVENTAKVTVVANSVDKDNKVTFAVKLSDFDSLKGIDLKVIGTGLTFSGEVTATNVRTPLQKDTNYTVSGSEIHIVELTEIGTNPVIISGSATLTDAGTHEISVSCDLAKSGTELYTLNTDYTLTSATVDAYVAPADGKVEIEEGQETGSVSQPAAQEGYFIPFGAVFSGDINNPTYYDKDGEGKFNNIPAGANVKKFPIPSGGFGTYGVSDNIFGNAHAKQFGNYVGDYQPSNRTYGTFLIVGDWTGYKNWYLSNKGYSEKELVIKLFDAYNNSQKPMQDGYRAYGIDTNSDGTKDIVVQVKPVKQSKYLWKNSDNTKMEYGIRFNKLQAGWEYATVAMYEETNTVTFADQIKTEKYTG